MDKYEVLKHCFGHSRFRQGQEELVDAVLSGRDAPSRARRYTRRSCSAVSELLMYAALIPAFLSAAT